MNSMRKTTLLVLLVAFPLHSSAGECRKEHTKRLNIEECLSAKVGAADKRLDEYLSVVNRKYMKDLPKIVSFLAESQKAWRVERETFCQSASELFAEGTVSNAMYLRCVLQQTEKRTHDVWEWHLTYWDSTPPDLPEPVMDIDSKPK